jgi:hypothetical protein
MVVYNKSLWTSRICFKRCLDIFHFYLDGCFTLIEIHLTGVSLKYYAGAWHGSICASDVDWKEWARFRNKNWQKIIRNLSFMTYLFMIDSKFNN